MKRYLIWASGFLGLFIFNIIIEAWVLPALDLVNTDRNDLYFQFWWLLVVIWALFGLHIIGKRQSGLQASVTHSSQSH